ncbi:MAG: helicase-associated domain-containing protein [Candidatus Promineifilaceae bacterium]
MNDLRQALYNHDLLLLRVIGEWWELDLTGEEKPAAVAALAERLAGLDLQAEMASLMPEESAALLQLARADGRLPVAAFEREYGGIRMMGPGRMEREEPWLDPVSPAEELWYHGLLYRAFGPPDDGDAIEYYYLPPELLVAFGDLPPAEPARPAPTPARPLPAGPPERFTPASGRALEDLTTLLSLTQSRGLPDAPAAAWGPYLLDPDPTRLALLTSLAWELALLRQDEAGARPARKVLSWLKNGREAQLRELADAWSRSSWNELCNTPGLLCEGSGWQNDPLLARAALLEALPRTAEWRGLADLVAQLKQQQPDFQRPDSNYDTWYIRDQESGQYLSGFAHWDQVEGRLLRFLVNGPMSWLGLAEAGPAAGGQTVFRLTERALAWLADRPAPAAETPSPLIVQDDATVLAPPNAGRLQRFQLARVAEMRPAEPGQAHVYRLTPRSLAAAVEQGIDAGRVSAFLAEASGRELPAGVKRALERWAANGAEARLESLVVLRVSQTSILEKLRANPKTRPLLGEAVGDLVAAVRPQDVEPLRRAAAKLGLLLDEA